MGARRHGQEGALSPPPEMLQCFCAFVFHELFMHYFHNLSSASKGFAPRPHRVSIPGPRWETFVSRPLICPPPEKSCGGPRVRQGDGEGWKNENV